MTLAAVLTAHAPSVRQIRHLKQAERGDGKGKIHTMKKDFREALEDSPIIAAIKGPEGLQRCLACDSRIIFILYGDIISIPEIVETVKSTGKIALVHIDLIQGLSSREIAVDFIKKYTSADGIISTKVPLIQRGKELGLYTVMRYFLLDSMAYDNITKQISGSKPDVIEVLPALMPKIIRKICSAAKRPIIAGGLVSDREDIMSLLNAGATCISSTNEDVWFL